MKPTNDDDGFGELMEEVKELKEGPVGVNTTTEALLLLIYQAVDKLRFHNTD